MPSISARLFHPSLLSLLLLSPAAAQAQTVFVDQGPDWTDGLRQQFYTQDQGSRIMPLAWMEALTLPDGTGFLADGLVRYGYLPVPNRADSSLPAGFVAAGTGADMSVGMTCSACHTRQIEVSGTNYRIDGGPAIVDFQSLLSDLDQAVLAVLASDAAFEPFAKAVLGQGATPEAIAALKIEVETWSLRFHTLIEKSLPTPAWGPSRLDAVSMIFNRLGGLDLGPEPTYLIEENIVTADAPTRYPFLWNVWRQDRTQWPGFSDNGDEILGLTRNLGEVYGVFGEFHPQMRTGFLNRDYISDNSANFDGLWRLEKWMADIGPPKWPWEIDSKLAATGAAIFARSTDQGGCVDCHGIKPGAFRSILHSTWKTPVMDVGTDRRECQILGRTMKTGILEGSDMVFTDKKLGPVAPAVEILARSVIGAIIQYATHDLESSVIHDGARLSGLDRTGKLGYPPELASLAGAMEVRAPDDMRTDAQGPACGYEARVLQGIWAAAPYLHNGSVQSLAELLKPDSERATSFPLGPSYDIEAVGMAGTQSQFGYTLQTTDCSQNDSGSSHCGHNYGVTLSADEKAALLEYLKSL